MTLTSADESVSIFQGGKLRPGIYKIQNVAGQTYVDIHDRTHELCCRPATILEEKGLWEILPSGPGYTIRRLDPGKPDQFCIMLGGLENESVVSVSSFPIAWRVEIVEDELYRGCEYVRVFWGTTDMTWDLRGLGCPDDCTPVQLKENDKHILLCRIWKLISVEPNDGSRDTQGQTPAAVGSGSLPPYDGNQRCTCTHQSAEANDDKHGTTVTEVTVTTTTSTVTTRKKYRVDGD